MGREEDTHPLLSDRSVLDCPICLNELTIPVLQCENGHIICSCCLDRLSKPRCPTCWCSNPGSIRNRAMEQVLESATVFCAYRPAGCTAGRMPYTAKRSHEGTCVHAPYTCPLYTACGFMGSAAQLCTHLKQAHYEHCICIPRSVFQFYYRKDVRFVVFADDDDDESPVFVLETRTMKIYSVQDTPEPPPQFPYSFLAETSSCSNAFNFKPTTVTCCCANDADWNADNATSSDAAILDIIFEGCREIAIQLVDVSDDPMCLG